MNARIVGELSRALDYYQACEFVSRQRADGCCWCARLETISPVLVESYRDTTELAAAVDRAPAIGDELLDHKAITARILDLKRQILAEAKR